LFVHLTALARCTLCGGIAANMRTTDMGALKMPE